MVATVTLPIPDETYHRLELNAQATGRSIEEILAYVLQIGSPPMGDETPLFNPRSQVWSEHFQWIVDGTEVQGKTAIGRVTVLILQMNRPAITLSRRRWVAVGWHPPTD
jgi:hypothetical protein